MKWLSAVILLCGVAVVLGIIFISPTENIRLEAFCQTHGYGWRGTPRDGIFCVDERGRLIPPEKAWGEKRPVVLNQRPPQAQTDAGTDRP